MSKDQGIIRFKRNFSYIFLKELILYWNCYFITKLFWGSVSRPPYDIPYILFCWGSRFFLTVNEKSKTLVNIMEYYVWAYGKFVPNLTKIFFCFSKSCCLHNLIKRNFLSHWSGKKDLQLYIYFYKNYSKYFGAILKFI